MAGASLLQHLIQLSRLVTEPSGRSEILPLVAELAVAETGASAALVVLVEGDRARVAATKGYPGAMGWEFDADELGAELERDILEKCRKSKGHYSDARSTVLISDGALFGAIVVLFSAQGHGARAASPARRMSDDAMGVLGALSDLTASALSSAAQFERLEKVNAELRATRAALEKTEKLRALGEMAAGVSHDLKNILNPLGLFLQLARRQLDAGDSAEVKKSLAEMRTVVDRGVGLLESLRQFSRQTPDAAEQLVELDALAHEALAISRPRMSMGGKRAIPYIVEDFRTPPPVLGRPGEIVAALVNLIANAQDVLHSGGTISVRTGAERGGAYVVVQDDGPGMTAEVRDRIFEPFFTTKGDQGTGLGLAMVYATMVRHGGTVDVVSAPGGGARFELWFPTPQSG